MDDAQRLSEIYSEGLTFDEFVVRAGRKGGIFRRNYQATTVPEDLAASLARVVRHHGGLRLLVMAEDWCPDAAENVPVLAKMSEISPDIQMRCFVRTEHPELDDQLQVRGASRIPALLVCTPSYEVLGVWQERPQPAHAVIRSIKDLKEKGQPTGHLAAELRQGYQVGEFRRATMQEALQLVEERTPRDVGE